MSPSPRDGPPNEITLVYREVGRTHVFTAREFRGFHVGSSELARVYANAANALSEHVSLVFDRPVTYHAEMPFDEFQRLLNGEDGVAGLVGSFVIAKLAESPRAGAA